MTRPILYKANPLVKVRPLAGGVSLQNSMTGIAYKLATASFDIYQFFRGKERASVAEVQGAFTDYSTSDIAAVVDYFHAHKLILTDAPEDLAAITKKDVTLFELKDTPAPGQLCIVGVPFGAGNPLPNSCSSFPDNIRLHVRDKRISLREGAIRCNEVTNDFLGINEDYPLSATAYQHTCDLGNLFLNTQYESRQTIYERIYQVSKGLYATGTPLFLGGDHSISYSTIRAAAEHHGNICVVQFDAHTDTYTSSKMQLGDDGIHNHGNFMSKCMALDGVKQVYQLGIRGDVNFGLSRGHEKQHIIPCRRLQTQLAAGGLQLDIPADCKVYISIDIDVLDPLVAPATASPVAGGLHEEELLSCLQYLFDSYSGQIIGLDLVEVSPHLYDGHKTTATTAAHILLQIIQRFSYHAQYPTCHAPV